MFHKWEELSVLLAAGLEADLPVPGLPWGQPLSPDPCVPPFSVISPLPTGAALLACPPPGSLARTGHRTAGAGPAGAKGVSPQLEGRERQL